VSQSDYYRGLEIAERALRASLTSPAAEQAREVHEAITPWLDNTLLAASRACRRGCSHCCHLPVGVTFGEAMRLLEALQLRPNLQARVLADADTTAPMAWPQLALRPCPLLHDAACEVHPHRPLPCRALASTDAEACERGARGAGNVPVDDESFWRGIGAAAALAKAAEPFGTRELRSALAAMLRAAPGAAAAAFAAARQAGPEDRD